MITMTDLAKTELKSLLEKQGQPNLGLRVFVSPGGCSGMNYGMGFEERPEDGDQVLELDGVKLYIDQVSARYLQGAEIDYLNNLMGGGFTVHNPNAVSSCSCGHSFDTGESAGTAKACGSH